ncbi:unnamed protein product [Tuber aestivum]|uniref:Uncharacterized protein n=1 Tax=Tuber aestivum TaxID=59557 RepID=A0A292Q209_9PEZI|nr:unnamed protein product [Tuber aestivum]
MRLSKDGTPDAIDCALRVKIFKSIPENVEKFFPTPQRRQRLRVVPEGKDLGGVCGATLACIEEHVGTQKRPRMAAPMWISHSERPPLINGLLHALPIEIWSGTLNTSNTPTI